MNYNIKKWGKLEQKTKPKNYDLGGILGSILSGAATGSAIPGWGTAIGGAVGLIGGLLGSKKQKEEQRKQQELQNQQKLMAKQQQMNALPQSGGGLPGMLAMGGYLTPETLAKSGIYIKPSKRGTFTAAATKHGKSVQGFASQVLANKENYSPTMVKKANFAKNASKFKHALGGPEGGPGEKEQGLNTTSQVYVPSDKTQWFSESAALSKYKMTKDPNIILGYYANENYGPYKAGTHDAYKNQGKIYPVTAGEFMGLDTNKYPKPKDFQALSEYFYSESKKAKGGYINGGLVNPLSTQYGSIVGYNSGGTHSQNPLGGIPLSKAPTGEQNTVEQGETSFKFKNGKYIFSNRLKVKK